MDADKSKKGDAPAGTPAGAVVSGHDLIIVEWTEGAAALRHVGRYVATLDPNGVARIIRTADPGEEPAKLDEFNKRMRLWREQQKAKTTPAPKTTTTSARPQSSHLYDRTS